MHTLAQLKARFSAMPAALRITTGACLVIGAAFTVLPLIPGATFRLGERQVQWQEIWGTGVAYALFVVGPLMVAVGLAVFFGRAWVRSVLVLLPVFQGLPFLAVHWLLGAPSPFNSLLLFALSCVVWALVAAAYLFGSNSARQHFANAA